MLESGSGTSDNTTFLPISITYTIKLVNPTKSLIYYPIDTALWKGWIGAPQKVSMVDGNNQSIAFGGFTRESLGIVNATYAEPYYAKVDSGNGLDRLFGVVHTPKPVSSSIPWGAFTSVGFDSTSISPMLGYPPT